ncbi:MAG: EAL domain-containing protein [Phycisphaeraceae bacterium]
MVNSWDYLIFAAASVALFIGLRFVVTDRQPWVRRVKWGLLAVILTGGWFAVNSAGLEAQRRVQEMVSGYAPTYARELTQMGHADLSLNTPADDPAYRAMIAAQVRWLDANPRVNDIYTFRKRPDGRIVLLVDSETDYDANGLYEGRRESRTAIGEVYEPDDPDLERAFLGRAGFAAQPITDRWGHWVSAFVPMYDKEGNVEAVLGVDFDAARWVAQIGHARLMMIGYLAVLVALLGASATFVRYLYSAVQRAREAEVSCKRSQMRLHAMVEHLPAGAIHREGSQLIANKAVEQITGYARDELATLDAWFTTLFGPRAAEARQLYEQYRRAGFVEPATVTITCANGQPRDVEFAAYRYAGGEIWLMSDVTERLRTEAILRNRSLHDELTGLPNRAHLMDRLDESLGVAAVDKGYRFALLFLDLDRFKLINDTLGHLAGDELLMTIARRLNQCLDAVAAAEPAAEGHMLARMGGDEFTILLEGIGHADDAMRVAQRLLRALEPPLILAGQEVFPSVSIGIVIHDAAYTTAADMLRDADTAMYRAKADGKSRAALFDRAMREQVVDHVALENDLRRALERGEFSLAYQPIVHLETGRLKGFEALLRWHHPTRGPVEPTDFIPLAEETGLILDIGQWVLEEASRQLAIWQRSGRGAAGLTMSVNLSRRQLAQPDLPQRLARIIARAGIRPADLTIEITENTFMNDMEAGIATLHRLRSLGVRLAMDDFGTGYSSLGCLHRFPLDELKIDRSFITSMSARREYAAIVYAIVSLSHNMGIEVTAEGVEKAEHIAQLQAMECDLAQGYYFARPLTVADAQAFIDRTAEARVAQAGLGQLSLASMP